MVPSGEVGVGGDGDLVLVSKDDDRNRQVHPHATDFNCQVMELLLLSPRCFAVHFRNRVQRVW